jgi:hypothetical protein
LLQGFGDLYPRASLKWNEDVNNFMIYGTGDIPVGLYSKDNIANIGTGHGAIDLGGGYTYLDRRIGNEFTAVVGLTYNFTNPATHYQSGVDFHLDWAMSHQLSEQFSAGIIGYVYQQIGCDSGSGNTVGCFRTRIFGMGPQLVVRFPIGEMQASLGLKAYGEFEAKNTPQGWNTFLTLAISPAAAPIYAVKIGRPTEHQTASDLIHLPGGLGQDWLVGRLLETPHRAVSAGQPQRRYD